MSTSLKQAFEKAAQENYWNDLDSLSGPGSNLVQTRIIRDKIPELLNKLQVKKMLDAPCGDLFWMKEILPQILEHGIEYNGADIVPDLVEKNNSIFKTPGIKFHVLDLTKSPIPKVDLIFTRDCFIHLSYGNILSILENYQSSGSKYLLVSTYTKSSRRNYNVDGFYLYGRMLNLEKFPFFFPKPIELIVEGCTEGDGEFRDKSLGLWKISDLDLKKMKFYMRLSFVEIFSKTFKKSRNFLKRVLYKLRLQNSFLL